MHFIINDLLIPLVFFHSTDSTYIWIEIHIKRCFIIFNYFNFCIMPIIHHNFVQKKKKIKFYTYDYKNVYTTLICTRIEIYKNYYFFQKPVIVQKKFKNIFQMCVILLLEFCILQIKFIVKRNTFI